MFLSAAVVILPYMGLSAAEWYGAPTPLPFLLGTGFLSGSEYAKDFLTGEITPVFLEVGFPKLLIFAGASILTGAICILVLLKRHRNMWAYRKKRHLSILCVLLILTPCLNGCAEIEKIQGEIPYSSDTVYETNGIRCYLDFDDNTIYRHHFTTFSQKEMPHETLCCIISLHTNTQKKE